MLKSASKKQKLALSFVVVGLVLCIGLWRYVEYVQSTPKREALNIIHLAKEGKDVPPSVDKKAVEQIRQAFDEIERSMEKAKYGDVQTLVNASHDEKHQITRVDYYLLFHKYDRNGFLLGSLAYSFTFDFKQIRWNHWDPPRIYVFEYD